MADTIWIGTRKGLFSLRASTGRRGWKLAGPQFLGHIIHHVVQDPREPRVLLLAARTGHLGRPCCARPTAVAAGVKRPHRPLSAAAGHVYRRAPAPGCVLRHYRRRSMGEQQWRGELALPRPAPAGDLLGDSRELMTMACTVRIASPLRSYTAGAAILTACSSTLAEVLGSLEQSYPGIRFRICALSGG